MTADELLVKAFSSALDIPPKEINDSLNYNDNKDWDSTAHMILVAQLEADFDVMFEVDDIIDMNSFSKAKEILQKYNDKLLF